MKILASWEFTRITWCYPCLCPCSSCCYRSAANATTYGACHLFITTNQRTHPHKTDSTRARGGAKADLAVALEMEMELELRLDAVHAISAIKPRRIESHWNWRGITGGGEAHRCNKVLNHWSDINPKLWHTLSMQKENQSKANQSEPHMLRLSTPKRIRFVSAPTTTGTTIELGGPLSICLTSHQLMKAQ